MIVATASMPRGCRTSAIVTRDGRTYEYVVVLRAVQTRDFMTAHWAELRHSLLGKVSNRIIDEVRGVKGNPRVICRASL